MAYVLVAIGALMAAAGLSVVGYSTLYVRFEEYWVSLTAGTTLLAGGVITAALGFTIRALHDLGAALPAPGGALPAQGIALPPVEPLVSVAEPPAMFAAPEPEPEIENVAALSDESLSAVPTPAVPTPAVAPHPLRPSPREPAASREIHALEDRPVDEAIEPPTAPDVPTSPLADVHHEAPTAPHDVEPHDFVTPTEPEPLTPRRIFDESVDTAIKRDGLREPSGRPAAAAPTPPRPPEMPDDWLDRALAKLDEELPIAAPPARTLPRAVPLPSREMAARLDPPPRQPATASPEPAHAAAVAEDPAPQLAPEPEPPASAVIGRYEADGTSYVMYADGSIEAQSSAGVYRFSSMAELKSFIEN